MWHCLLIVVDFNILHVLSPELHSHSFYTEEKGLFYRAVIKFWVTVALNFTPITNLLLFLEKLITTKRRSSSPAKTHSVIKHKTHSVTLCHKTHSVVTLFCYRLRPLMTALSYIRFPVPKSQLWVWVDTTPTKLNKEARL